MTTGRINQVAIVSSTRTATRLAGSPTGGCGGEPPATSTDRAGRPSDTESVCFSSHTTFTFFTRETRPSADGIRRRAVLGIRHTPPSARVPVENCFALRFSSRYDCEPAVHDRLAPHQLVRRAVTPQTGETGSNNVY